MPTDTETGITPVAADGEPNAAALDAKRESKKNGSGGGGSMADRAAAEEQRRLDAEDGKLLDGVAGDSSESEEDDGQTFVWEQGRKVTLGTLIGRGVPVEHHFVFGGKRTKGAGGLMGFDAKPVMIVRGKPGPVKIVPTYDDDGTVTKVAVENHVVAEIVQPADSDEGMALIAHVLDERGYARVGKS